MIVAAARLDEVEIMRAAHVARLRALSADYALRSVRPRPGDQVADLIVAAIEAAILAEDVAAGRMPVPLPGRDIAPDDDCRRVREVRMPSLRTRSRRVRLFLHAHPRRGAEF